jgi:hypothetical protein
MQSGAPPPLSRLELAALAGLAALAVALRAGVAPHAPIHENLHGYAVLSGALTHWEGVRSAYLDLLGALGLRFGAVFGANALISSLAPVFVALVARESTRRRPVGLLAGLALALHPLAVRLGGATCAASSCRTGPTTARRGCCPCATRRPWAASCGRPRSAREIDNSPRRI